LPLQGVSAISRSGQPFDDPPRRPVSVAETGVELPELDCHINDPPFAEAAAHKLLELTKRRRSTGIGPAPTAWLFDIVGNTIAFARG
jgi:hypothetical protein